MSQFLTIFLRDVKLAYTESGGALASLGFFVVSYVLFAFALGAEEQKAFLFPIIATLMVFAALLSLGQMFERDEEDGTLEQYLLLALSHEWLVVAKMAAYALAVLAPLTLCAVAVHGLQGLAFDGTAFAKLILLALSLAAIGALSGALTLIGSGNALVRSLIALPLTIPALILATLPDQPNALGLLAAFTATIIPLSAWFSGMALRR
jgi:heme exporter protein CcmB